MQECQLKMLEMSDGQIATRFDSFLGLRHGPQVFVNEECAVIASLSEDETVQKYEIDLLEEMKTKKQGCGTLVICSRRNPAIDNISDHVIELSQGEPGVPDQFRIMTDVVVGQMLATLKCLNLGLKPDTPSASGVIHRVVQGVTIYGS
jgi:tagatose-6-phosphate ketose/aldose isomerase